MEAVKCWVKVHISGPSQPEPIRKEEEDGRKGERKQEEGGKGREGGGIRKGRRKEREKEEGRKE